MGWMQLLTLSQKSGCAVEVLGIDTYGNFISHFTEHAINCYWTMQGFCKLMLVKGALIIIWVGQCSIQSCKFILFVPGWHHAGDTYCFQSSPNIGHMITTSGSHLSSPEMTFRSEDPWLFDIILVGKSKAMLWIIDLTTACTKKYPHCYPCVLFCCSVEPIDFTHILQGNYPGTGEIVEPSEAAKQPLRIKGRWWPRWC